MHYGCFACLRLKSIICLPQNKINLIIRLSLTVYQIPIEQRICDKCNANDVEDEIHCMLMCDRNSIPKLEFLSKVSSLIPNFENLDKIQRFTSLMSDKRPIQALGIYLYKVMP